MEKNIDYFVNGSPPLSEDDDPVQDKDNPVLGHSSKTDLPLYLVVSAGSSSRVMKTLNLYQTHSHYQSDSGQMLKAPCVASK